LKDIEEEFNIIELGAWNFHMATNRVQGRLISDGAVSG
jgi:hypothetical protein